MKRILVIGNSGAGKSTLAKILAGLVKADSGIFQIDGTTVDPRQVSRMVAIVQQELSLVPNMSAAENIFLGLIVLSISESTRSLQLRSSPTLTPRLTFFTIRGSAEVCLAKKPTKPDCQRTCASPE